MSMRVLRLATHLRPEEALTIVELLDQLRDSLMLVYGDDIGAMLRQASAQPATSEIVDREEPF
jgi:hypothetical protein